jgi:hypothetical protein
MKRSVLPKPLLFVRGGQMYQITPNYAGCGYIGFCNGRILATALDRAEVARKLITAL